MKTFTYGRKEDVYPQLSITALDEPNSGGGHCHYTVEIAETKEQLLEVKFQTGPLPEGGVNGIINEALLAIVIDRLSDFAKGQFSSRETSLALTKCQEALHWMEHRAKERQSRGVLGKHEK